MEKYKLNWTLPPLKCKTANGYAVTRVALIDKGSFHLERAKELSQRGVY
jgi:hypothetical protein